MRVTLFAVIFSLFSASAAIAQSPPAGLKIDGDFIKMAKFLIDQMIPDNCRDRDVSNDQGCKEAFAKYEKIRVKLRDAEPYDRDVIYKQFVRDNGWK